MGEVLGEYTIERVLGEGGFGTVYDARRATEPVALKVLREDLELTDAERARFLKEAQTLGALAHPSIVSLVDHGELDDGRPFIAMERLRGHVLLERIEGTPLPLDTALRLFAQLADAVATMHAAGLVHRDIKPENIMLVDDDDRAVLLDLGIAKGVSEGPSTTTRAGRVRGTPAYMAPERFYGTSASERSDLYELALVLYMMLLGRLPWADPTDPAARHRPIPPANAGVDKAVSDVIVNALSVDATQRPISVRAFSKDVDRAARGSDLASQTTAAQPLAKTAAPPSSPSPSASPSASPSSPSSLSPPSRGAITPDTTPPPASAMAVRRHDAPRWRAPLAAALGAAAIATVPWLWTSRKQSEQLAEIATALNQAAPSAPARVSSQPPAPAPPTRPSAATVAVAEPSASPSVQRVPGPVVPGTREFPPTSAAASGVAAPVVTPLGPPGPPPPAPWCDKYLALMCSPKARAWSPTACTTAQSVVAKNGAVYARLPDKSGHDRVCERQYHAQKNWVRDGIAKHEERQRSK